jgi:hypothetical protein
VEGFVHWHSTVFPLASGPLGKHAALVQFWVTLFSQMMVTPFTTLLPTSHILASGAVY